MSDVEKIELTGEQQATRAGESKRITIAEMIEGARLHDGGIIEAVFSKSADHVIYSVSGRRGIRYRYTNKSAEAREAIRKFETVQAQGNRKLKGTPDPQLDVLAIGALRTIFQTNSPDIYETAIAPLQEYVNGLGETKAVIGKTRDFIVWIDYAGELKFHHRRDLQGVEHSVSEFIRVQALANALLPASYRENFNGRIGAALVAAFRMQPGDKVDKLFGPLEDYINRFLSNNLKIRYLIVTSSAALVLIGLAYVFHQMLSFPYLIKTGLISVAGGYIGTFISVFERSKTLSVGDNESMGLIIIQGLLRVFIGGIFAFVAYIAARSGMAFSIFNDTTSGLILLGIAAGFSERLIPDLIQGFSPSQEQTGK